MQVVDITQQVSELSQKYLDSRIHADIWATEVSMLTQPPDWVQSIAFWEYLKKGG